LPQEVRALDAAPLVGPGYRQQAREPVPISPLVKRILENRRFVQRHVDLRMLAQAIMQEGRAGLLRADDHEMGQG